MADQELSLINKVELRIAMADTDTKFESALNLYLCPLLLKLASPHQSVRQELLKFIQQLIPRINSAKTIQLPFTKLIEQAKKPNLKDGLDGSTVQLYTLLFASRAVDRLPDDFDQRVVLVRDLVLGISQFSEKFSARFFHIFIKLLKCWETPDRGTDDFEALKKKLDLQPDDAKFLVNKIETLFLLQPVTNNDGVIPRGYTCPGLSAKEVSFLTYDAGVSYKADELARVKKNLSIFLPLFDNDLLIPVLLIGVNDVNDTVGNNCANLLRKIPINHEIPELIDHLIELFTGNKTIPKAPVNQQIQERIISQVLTGSKIAANSDKVPIIVSIGLNAQRFPKLKKSTIIFIQWFARNSKNIDNQDISANNEFFINIAQQLRNNLHSEGWPKLQISQSTNYANEIKYRQLQYETLGEILKRNFNLVQDGSFIEFLFDSLLGDLAELRPTIQEALSALVTHLPSLPSDTKSKIKILGQVYLKNDDFFTEDPDAVQSVRFTIIKYINIAFPFEDPEARMLNVLGTSKKNRSDVIEESTKGLHPYWFKILQNSSTLEFKSTNELLGIGTPNVKFPDFNEFITLIQSYETESKKNPATSCFNYSVQSGIEFALRVLITHATESKSTVIVQDQDWATRLEKSLEFDDSVIQLTKDYFLNLKGLDIFLKLLLNQFTNENINNPIYSKIFIKVISFSPQNLVGDLIEYLPRLLKLVLDSRLTNDDVLLSTSNSLGLVGSHPSNSDAEVLNLINQLLSSDLQINDSKIMSLGFLTSRLILRNRVNILDEDILNHIYEFLISSLESKNIKTSDSSIISIGEVAKVGGFTSAIKSSKIETFKTRIIELLTPKVKNSNEKAIITLSYFALNEPESISEDFTDIEKTIFETYNSKQIEVFFTSGEAFSILSNGWNSTYLKNKLDIQSDHLTLLTFNFERRFLIILTKIIEFSKSSKPFLRKAGCIWLLSLVQFCKTNPEIKNYSNLIHISFMRFLVDKDELIQEAASRGLSMIYELGDSDLKETLVKGLLKSFTDSTNSTKLNSGTISEDSEIFEPGILKTDDGSISTYKDILNLASEIGDPSLVYKFMSLAKSSALWSSRKGIAFGLGNIMSKSSLDKLLFENKTLSNRLIPKLFRYKYDPNASVSKSMNDIWNSIISDNSKTINEYYNAILDELLKSMGNKEWRVREASTLALTDLLQHLPIEKYETRMEEIWTMGFRALDDIKESVRNAANGLTRSLSITLVNGIKNKNGDSKSSKEILGKLLPFLLGNKGILSDAEDVRDFSLETIINLIKKSGKAIKPFISELIEQFVLLMSTLEPQVINYLALNADKYKIKNDDLDSKRLQSVGSSPIMNALEKLIDLIDEEIIGDVVNRLQRAIKQSVGLPSKVASSRVIVTLTLRHFQIMKPYGDLLLATCIQQLGDRNLTVSSSFASSAGYLCRLCSIESIVDYSEKIQSLYFDSEDTKSKIISGIASESVSKYSGDKFTSLATEFLPLAFIARNDSNTEIAKPFDNEWNENTSGLGAIKLYIHEICEIIKRYISSSDFNIRQTLAKSISKACDAINNSSGMSSSIEELFDVLVASMQGRSWSGKEELLKALVTLSLKSKKFIETNPEIMEKLNKIILLEAKRRNKQYQKHAIISLTDFARGYPSIGLQQEIIEIFSTVLLEKEYYEEEDDEENDDSSNKNGGSDVVMNEKSSQQNLAREAEQLKFFNALVNGFTSISNQFSEEYLFLITNTINKILGNNEVYIPTWKSEISIAESLSKAVNEIVGVEVLSAKVIDELAKTWKEITKNNLNIENVENVKIQTIRLGGKLIDLKNNQLKDIVLNDLRAFNAVENNSIVKVEVNKVLQ